MGLYQLQIKVNQFLNWVGRKRKYSLREGEIGINLGCEIRTLPSFVGIDGSFLLYFMKNKLFPKLVKRFLYEKTSSAKIYSFDDFVKKISQIRIIHHDFRYGIPFRNESVGYIFSSNFLEHLTEPMSMKLLMDCFRVLKKNGKILFIVPDLDEEVRTIEKDITSYKKNRKIEPLQKYLTPCFAPEGEFATHKVIYNFEALKRTLEMAGFNKIKRMKPFEGDFPDLKKLETISEKGMIVEAEK